MPLNFGKLGAAIALITVAAFIGWLLFTSFFASETVEEDVGMLTETLSLAGFINSIGKRPSLRLRHEFDAPILGAPLVRRIAIDRLAHPGTFR